MKSRLKNVFTATVFFLSFQASAGQQQEDIDVSDEGSCNMFLCMINQTGMYGKEDTDGQCDSEVKKFFDIRKTHHGHFSGSRTKNARSGPLEQCAEADPSEISAILDMFGSAKNLF